MLLEYAIKDKNKKPSNSETAKLFIGFYHKNLNKELLKNDASNAEFSDFNNTFVSVLNKHAPQKEIHVKINNVKTKKFMDKLYEKL